MVLKFIEILCCQFRPAIIYTNNWLNIIEILHHFHFSTLFNCQEAVPQIRKHTSLQWAPFYCAHNYILGQLCLSMQHWMLL